MRHRNNGLRKRCRCKRKNWPNCRHSWSLNFKPRGGPHYQLSMDRELGRHIDSKSEAETEATHIRAAILAGTFRVSASEPIFDSYGVGRPHNPQNLACFCKVKRVGAEM